MIHIIIIHFSNDVLETYTTRNVPMNEVRITAFIPQSPIEINTYFHDDLFLRCLAHPHNVST